MSLVPIVSNVISAYRADQLSLNDSTSIGADCFTFSDDGTKIITDENESALGDWEIEVRTLSTAWDVSTAGSATNVSFAELGPTATAGFDGGMVFLTPTRFVGMLRRSGNEKLFEYTFSSDYGGTTTYVGELDTGRSARWFLFSNSGTKLHVCGTDDIIYVATLSTAYDITSAGSFSTERDWSSTYTDIHCACFGRTEKQLLLMTDLGLREWTLSVSGDISSATGETARTATGSEWIGFGNGGKKFYTASGTTIREYASVG